MKKTENGTQHVVFQPTFSTAKLQAALGKKGPALQPYRKRLLEGGVIEAPRRGELVFAVPYLAEYLLSEMKESRFKDIPPVI